MLLVLFSANSLAAHQITKWPDNKQGAISLTFDDGCPSHISIGVPSLDARGFKGTFFLPAGSIGSESPGWGAWRAAADNGHEIGSHTLSHPDLPSIPLSEAQFELEESKAVIDAEITSQQCLTFAWPGGLLNDAVAAIADGIYIASRGVGCNINSEPIDFTNVNSCSPGDLAELISNTEKAERQGKWFDMHFHSLDNGNDCYRDTLFTTDMWLAYLDYLTTKRPQLYIGTFGSVVKYIKERTSANLSVVSDSNDQIVLSLTDGMDDAVYDQPLTIRSEVPSDWVTATVQQGGSTTEVPSTVEGPKTVVYYSAVPDGGYITLQNPLAAEPRITALVPSFVVLGSPGFALQVTGNNFVPGSVVRWNGSDRTTTYVSATELHASVISADLASQGSIPVSVSNPGGSLSHAVPFDVRALPPSISGITPSWEVAGGPSFTLIVDGSDFVSGTKVRWSGSDRTTSFVSETELEATIPAADIATAGNAVVTVYTAAPGGGTSNGIDFDILPTPVFLSLSLAPSSVTGGNSSTGTVTLDGPAPGGSVVVSLSSSNPSVATVPSGVTIPEGSASATFMVATVAVTSTMGVNISALYGGVTKSAPLTLVPPMNSAAELPINNTSPAGNSSGGGGCSLASRETDSSPGGIAADLLLAIFPLLLLRRQRATKHSP